MEKLYVVFLQAKIIWGDVVWYWQENPRSSDIRSGVLKGCSTFTKKETCELNWDIQI